MSYRFVTDFEVRARAEDVFGLIVEPEPWLAIWSDLVDVRRVRPPGPDGTGGLMAGAVQAPLGYRIGGRIEIVEADPPTSLRMRVTGHLDGHGTWTLHPVDGGTRTRFMWTVRPAVTWLRLLTPVARPLFEAGHEIVVRHAVESAAAVLDAELVAFRSEALHFDGPAPPP